MSSFENLIIDVYRDGKREGRQQSYITSGYGCYLRDNYYRQGRLLKYLKCNDIYSDNAVWSLTIHTVEEPPSHNERRGRDYKYISGLVNGGVLQTYEVVGGIRVEGVNCQVWRESKPRERLLFEPFSK